MLQSSNAEGSTISKIDAHIITAHKLSLQENAISHDNLSIQRKGVGCPHVTTTHGPVQTRSLGSPSLPY